MAKIPIRSGTTFYTVEGRRMAGDDDGALPGNAVIVLEVDLSRSEPAWSFDAAVPPSGYGDTESVMWKVGETFEDAVNGITIAVDAASADSFDVTLTSTYIFEDGFESGDLTGWSASTP